MEISGVLFVLLMLALIAALAEHSENRKLRAKLEARRIQGSKRMLDWLSERKTWAKAWAAMELICDRCHERYRCSQDELDEECDMCPVPDAVYRLVAGIETDCHTSAAALVRNDNEEARG